MSTDDQFTSQIIASALDAAALEMFDVLRRAAMSPIIYEVLDVGTGITDAQGNLISSGAGIPSFVGVLDKSVKAILSKHKGHISDGDIFITNDPNYGGVTHLNDIVVIEPVFFEGDIIAFVASIAHWGDIGGKTPGSMPVDAIDIFAEGLRLPNVKLARAGKLNAALLDIIKVNSRLPEFVEGDLKAQMAAGERAKLLIANLCERYGKDALKASFQDSFDQAFKRAITGLGQLQKGVFQISQEQDDGSVFHAKIKITENAFEIDLTDNPDQVAAPHNTSRDSAIIACQIFFKALTDPSRQANAGSFTPLKVLTREGSVFHAQDTAPHGYYFETRMRLVDMLWKCLANEMPNKLPAGHFASIYGTVIAGTHPDTGRKYTMVEPQMGGWGATSERDGVDGIYSTNHGDTFNCPIEIAEARYGFEVVEKSLRERKHIEGFHTGGRGILTKYRLKNEASFSAGMSHAQIPVWSIKDAPDGGLNSLEIKSPDGEINTYNFVSGLKLEENTIISIATANGGSVRKQ